MDSLGLKKERIRFLAMLIVGLLTLLILAVIHINQGSLSLDFNGIINAIFKPEDIMEHHLIRNIRISRLLIGIIAGGALGVSGVLYQSLLKNPLASASTLGINAGAYFVLVVFAVFFPSTTLGVAFLPSFIGALGTALIVYFLGGRRRMNPIQMALAGVAVSLVFSSMTAALQILFSNETAGLFLWGSGSLAQGSWKGVYFSFLLVLVNFIIVLLISSKIDILSLGDDIAISLGVNVRFYRQIGILIAVVMTSAIITVVGPIGFVGLMAPHILKRVGLRKHRDLIVLSFICGSVILLGADIISRLFTMGSYELPVGAFTAIIGAPWLIYLAYRNGAKLSSTSKDMNIVSKKSKISYKLLIVLILITLIFTFLISLRYGGVVYSFKEIISSLLGRGDSISSLVINQLRLPRILSAVLAGMVLGLSGFLLQTVLKNPLAEPSVLGVTQGAALGALALMYFLPVAGQYLVSIVAFIGAILAALLVFFIARKSKLNPAVLVLVGMAVTALSSAGVNIIIVNTKVGKAASLSWLAGSTYASSWSDVSILGISLLIFFPIAWVLGKDLDAVMLGDEIATGLGTEVFRVRVMASLVGILLAAIAVSTVGTVGFIGLLAPHMARLLVGVKHRRVIIITVLIGALIFLFSDFLGRVIIYPDEIPSGLVVALVGGPYFIYLMYSMSKIKR